MRRRIGSMIVVLVATLFISALDIAQGQGEAQTGGLPALQAQLDAFDHPWTQFGTDVFYDGGDVGLGTTAPGIRAFGGNFRDLTISGVNGNSNAALELRNPAPNTAASLGPIIWYSNTDNAGAIDVVTDGATDAAHMAFYTQATGGEITEQMRLTSTGNVGLGTQSPTSGYRLDVFGNLIFSQANPEIRFNFGGSAISQPAANTLVFSTSGTERMWIDNEGRVGIRRTPTTTNALEVEGNASKTTAGDWLANSDARLKTDIQEVENALESINRLRPVKFRYTQEYRAQHPSIKDRHYYNFIAQEFQEIFPESVQDDGTGYLQIDTYNVRPYLVGAVQELSKMMEVLQAENEALQESNEKLQARIEELKEMEVVLHQTKSELHQLKAKMAQLDAIEDMLLAISTDLPKEKLVKCDDAGLDEAQKTIQ